MIIIIALIQAHSERKQQLQQKEMKQEVCQERESEQVKCCRQSCGR